MKCPYCDKDMEKGYIHCNDGWRALSWRADDVSKKVKIHPWTKGFFVNKIEDVFYCANCQIIIKKLNEEPVKF